MALPTLDHCSSSPRPLALGFQDHLCSGHSSTWNALLSLSSEAPPLLLAPRPSAIRAGTTDPACLPGTRRARCPCVTRRPGAALSLSAPSPTFRKSQWAGPWVSSQHPAQGPCSGKEQGGLPCPPPTLRRSPPKLTCSDAPLILPQCPWPDYPQSQGFA